MSAFEYLSVFLSLIMGLAVVHLLGGISLILDQRVTARLSGIHLTWVANMFLVIMWVWWANWDLEQIDVFSPLHYVSMVLFSVVLYLMCGLLFPVRGKEVEDFHEQFEMNRSRFFVLGLALILAAAIKGYVDRVVLEEPHTTERFIMLTTLAVLFGIAARTSNNRFHWPLAVGFLLLTVRWITTE
ncbi:MAG: hypothetical protein AAGE01_05780 [Pseudomonadota bacterium]